MSRDFLKGCTISNMGTIHKHTAYSYSACTFEFALNIYKHCSQDLNKLYIYEKGSYLHVRFILFYENWFAMT